MRILFCVLLFCGCAQNANQHEINQVKLEEYHANAWGPVPSYMREHLPPPPDSRDRGSQTWQWQVNLNGEYRYVRIK